MRVTRAVCAIYAAVCIAALVAVAAGALGWLSLTRGWAGALAELLGMPWSLLVAQMSDPGAVGKVVLVAAAMVLNLAIIFAVGRWLANRT